MLCVVLIGEQVLFIEHVAPSDLQRKRHTAIECIPIPRAAAAQSVGYFKKALLEGDEEWSQHEGSRCIDTRGKGIRRCVRHVALPLATCHLPPATGQLTRELLIWASALRMCLTCCVQCQLAGA